MAPKVSGTYSAATTIAEAVPLDGLLPLSTIKLMQIAPTSFSCSAFAVIVNSKKAGANE